MQADDNESKRVGTTGDRPRRKRRRRRHSGGRSDDRTGSGTEDGARAARGEPQRGGGAQGDRSDTGARRRKRKRPRRGERPRGKPASPLEARPEIDETKATDAPLTAHEREAIREHFRFLARHRKMLRIKLNAAEDLLLNGVREPEHRGICKHLLGKVDRACVKAALARIEEPEKRTRLLEGVVRFSRDAAIVLLYLESLSSSGSRDEAAAAVSIALEQLEPSEISSAQMRRLLGLVAELFDARQLPQLVLGMLGNEGFRAAFDESIEGLPASLTALFGPLRAVHAAVVEGNESVADSETLRSGLALLLDSPDRLLGAHPEPVRRRLYELALDLAPRMPRAERALGTLLESFAPESRQFSQLGVARARRLLADHRDDEARALLEAIREHHPGYKLPARWLSALDVRRVGRVALLDDSPESIHMGLWLDRQRQVWVRVGQPAEAEAFEHAAAIHGRLLLPGVAPLLVGGRTDDGTPYFAVPRVGVPASHRIAAQRPDAAVFRDLALAGVEILSALAWAGVILPDDAPERFLLGGTERLWLMSLVGARLAPPEEAREAAVEPARDWCRRLVAGRGGRARLTAALEQADTLEDLAAALASG